MKKPTSSFILVFNVLLLRVDPLSSYVFARTAVSTIRFVQCNVSCCDGRRTNLFKTFLTTRPNTTIFHSSSFNSILTTNNITIQAANMASNPAGANAIEWALRVCQSMAFAIHGVLGVTEPYTGCVRNAFGDKGAMPGWFWPVAGILLWTVAIANFSHNDNVVLAAQAYIAAFHMGGFFYHVRIGHHPLTGVAPAVFAFLAFLVVGIRTGSFLVAGVGWGVCTIVAFGLSRILVTPPSPVDGSTNLLEE